MSDEFEIKNPEVEELLRKLGRELKADMPPGFGFTLFIQSIGEGGATFYISSLNREGNIKALQEFIDKQKEKTS